MLLFSPIEVTTPLPAQSRGTRESRHPLRSTERAGESEREAVSPAECAGKVFEGESECPETDSDAEGERDRERGSEAYRQHVTALETRTRDLMATPDVGLGALSPGTMTVDPTDTDRERESGRGSMRKRVMLPGVRDRERVRERERVRLPGVRDRERVRERDSEGGMMRSRPPSPFQGPQGIGLSPFPLPSAKRAAVASPAQMMVDVRERRVPAPALVPLSPNIVYPNPFQPGFASGMQGLPMYPDVTQRVPTPALPAMPTPSRPIVKSTNCTAPPPPVVPGPWHPDSGACLPNPYGSPALCMASAMPGRQRAGTPRPFLPYGVRGTNPGPGFTIPLIPSPFGSPVNKTGSVYPGDYPGMPDLVPPPPPPGVIPFTPFNPNSRMASTTGNSRIPGSTRRQRQRERERERERIMVSPPVSAETLQSMGTHPLSHESTTLSPSTATEGEREEDPFSLESFRGLGEEGEGESGFGHGKWRDAADREKQRKREREKEREIFAGFQDIPFPSSSEGPIPFAALPVQFNGAPFVPGSPHICPPTPRTMYRCIPIDGVMELTPTLDAAASLFLDTDMYRSDVKEEEAGGLGCSKQAAYQHSKEYFDNEIAELRNKEYS
eukprot:g7204.t1